MIGQTISHYRIVDKLGAGGMGIVYKAEDLRLGRFVALKFLPPEFARDPDALERFSREARAASALDHPGICTIYDIDDHEGQPFLIMQLLEGQTLLEKISDKPLKPGELFDIAIQILDALAVAHEQGIIHRDIKPANLFVTRANQAKILDFGLAKSSGPVNQNVTQLLTVAGEDLTSSGAAVGTIAYMSPEQARGESVDARTDLFSFGAVLYEMATGHRAFAGQTPAITFDSILHGPTPSAVHGNPRVPQALDQIITRSLEKDRALRYQSATDLKADLQRASRDSTATATPAGTITPIRESRGKKVFLAIGLFGVALFLLLQLSLYLLRGNAETLDSLAVLPFVNESGNPDTEYLSSGISENILDSLSQLPGLRVMSSNSVSRYKEPTTDAQAAGRELGVRAVLTGRLVLRGDNLSVRTELVKVQDNSQVWGEQYNRKLSDILSVQEDISRQISGALRLRLSPEQGDRLAKRSTENPAAYELYLKGLYESDRLSTGGLQRAKEYFTQAIALDENYARAYEGLAWYYWGVGDWLLPMPETGPKGMEAARKAVRLDDSLAEAHVSLGAGYLWYEYQWAQAEKESLRALELNPRSERAHQMLCFYLLAVGRTDDAIAEGRQMIKDEPLSPVSASTLGTAFLQARRSDDAIEELKRSVKLDSSYWETYSVLGQAYLSKGSFPEAITELRKARELEDNISEPLAFLGRAYALQGNTAEARKILAELEARSKQRHVSNYLMAIVHASLGDKDKALTFLEKAYQDHSFYMSLSKLAPELDSLRSEPQFQKIITQLAFPEKKA